MPDEVPEMDEEFVSESGKSMTRRQIGYARWKRNADVELTDEGFVVDGILYEPIESGE